MKIRIMICVLVACFCSSVFMQAADLTPEAKNFQSNIMQFLKEEGFSPSIDESDNSVNFKKEGELHWISVSGSNPFYIELHRSGFKCNDVDRNVVIDAVNEGNKKVRCAKAMLYDSSIALVVEMYCHSAEAFRYVFYKNMEELKTLEETVSDYYNSHLGGSAQNLPFTIKSTSIANTDYNGNIITSYGTKIYSYKTQYLKPKIYVNLKRAGTYDIYVKFYTPSGLSTATSGGSPEGYSYRTSVTMTTGVDSYELSGWGGSDSGHWKSGEYRLEFYYEGEMIGQRAFTIY